MRRLSIYCRLPARARDGLRTARRGHFLQLGHPEPSRPPDRLHATTFAIYPLGQRVVPITVRVGGRTHRYIFGNAAAAVGPSADIYMRNMIRARRFASPQGIFLDRRLKAAERRHVRVRADIGRDADVLAVSERASRVCLGCVPCGSPRDRRGDHPYVVGGGGCDPGERGRDRAAPRRQRSRSLRRAPIPRRLPAAPRGKGPRSTAACPRAKPWRRYTQISGP